MPICMCESVCYVMSYTHRESEQNGGGCNKYSDGVEKRRLRFKMVSMSVHSSVCMMLCGHFSFYTV